MRKNLVMMSLIAFAVLLPAAVYGAGISCQQEISAA